MQTTVNKLLNSIAIDNNVVQNALSNDNEVIQCACVRGGHLKSNYEDWVQHSKPSVRKLIAENYPEYIPLLPCETDWEKIEVGNYLLEQTKPKLDVLEKFLTKVGLLDHNLKVMTRQFKHEMLTCNMTTIEKVMALQLKHETLTRGMTIIEKTMSLQQLWESNSPFWTEKLTGQAVINVLRAFRLSEQTQEPFDFESVYNMAMALNERLTNPPSVSKHRRRNNDRGINMQQNFNAFDLLVPPERPEKSDPFQRHIFKLKQDTWDYRFDNLKTYRKPTIQELEEFFSQPPYDFSTIFHSLKLKYRALTTEPSIIEKTMSPYQLYASGSPLWTSELTAEEADAVLKHTVGTCTLTEDEFNDRYSKAITGELTKKPFTLNFWQ